MGSKDGDQILKVHRYELLVRDYQGSRLFHVDLPVPRLKELTPADLMGFTDSELIAEMARRVRMREE